MVYILVVCYVGLETFKLLLTKPLTIHRFLLFSSLLVMILLGYMARPYLQRCSNIRLGQCPRWQLQ